MKVGVISNDQIENFIKILMLNNGKMIDLHAF